MTPIAGPREVLVRMASVDHVDPEHAGDASSPDVSQLTLVVRP
ncbi:hypothetical protein [Pseudonocardia sp. HH130629-09]|nr:hypothetical protein [Pseudonocardia sp. HH130629-09]